MSGFSGINQFGSLTVNGQKLTFEDFDKDKNGEISKEEYDSLLKEMKLDTVELSTVDRDGDETISEDEFALWEQKTQMQDAVNALAGTISKDFAGKTQYLGELTTALKDYIEEFAQDYSGDVADMAEAFKEALPEKYEEVKNEIFKNDPTTIKSEVLDNIISGLESETNIEYSRRGIGHRKVKTETPLYDSNTLQRIGKKLEAAADNFIKSYKGDNLREDLTQYLQEFLTGNDSERMADDVEKYRAVSQSFGTYVDSNELSELKEAAKEFLKAALAKGITINLNGNNIKTEAAITTILKKFDNAADLNDAMEKIFAGLSTSNIAETIRAEEKAKAEAEAEQKFVSVKGSEYAINPALIDYSKIEGYHSQKTFNWESTKIGWMLRGTDMAKRAVASKAKAYLYTEANLKNQMMAQLESKLEAKGIPFSKVASVFENVYTNSVDGAVDASMVQGEGWECNIKNAIDKLIELFNTNIEKAIDEMNSSNTDLDLQDINLTQFNATVQMKDVSKEQRKHLALLSLRNQLLKKAQTMCKANGVTFNQQVFDTICNNAESNAPFSVLNKQKFAEKFLNEFKTNYTAWVESEKTNAAK